MSLSASLSPLVNLDPSHQFWKGYLYKHMGNCEKPVTIGNIKAKKENQKKAEERSQLDFFLLFMFIGSNKSSTSDDDLLGLNISVSSFTLLEIEAENSRNEVTSPVPHPESEH